MVNSIDKIAKQQYSELDAVSKMVLTYGDEKIETVPNAVTVGGLKEVGVKRIKPQEIPVMLLSHPAIERGIEFKFNRIIKQLDKHNIGNNIFAKDTSKLATQARQYCEDILKNTDIQPVTWLKQFGRDAMRFGDNYLMLVPNRNKNKILRWELQNPMFFSPMFDLISKQKTGTLVGNVFSDNKNVVYRIDPKTKKPKEYTQLKKVDSTPGFIGFSTKDPKAMNLVTFGKTFPATMVVQLNFDRIADEVFGIPIVQTLWNTVKQILRVEDAGAETMVAFGYNRWIANTSFRTGEKMRTFAKSIENIAKRSTVVLPEGVTLNNVQPGSTEFDKVHNILLSLIAMRLGISIIQLKGEGADINKSTLSSMMEDIRADFFADELELERVINEAFLKSCIYKYKLNTVEKRLKFPFPKFVFNEVPQDELKQSEIALKKSFALRNMANMVDKLSNSGMEKEGKELFTSVVNSLYPQISTQKDFEEKPSNLQNDYT